MKKSSTYAFIVSSFKKCISPISFFTILVLLFPGKTQAQSSDPFSLQNQFIFKISQNSQTYLNPQTTTVNHESNTLQWEPIQAVVMSNPNSPLPPTKLNLDQVRNGSGAMPVVPPAVAPWVNGNAGSSNAHYAEGWSIPYRCVVDNLAAGSHSITIEWDTRQSTSSAIDFVTNYDFMDYPAGSHVSSFGHPQEVLNPLNEISGITSGTSVTIPAPNFTDAPGAVTSYYALVMAVTNPGNPDLNANKFSVYNANITSFEYVEPQGNVLAQAASTKLKIFFTNAIEGTVVIAWGGHIAKGPGVWGDGNSAAAVSGSPYHTRLIEWDSDGAGPGAASSIGNQDRSLSADAVLDPPTCEIAGPTPVQCGSTNEYTTAGVPAGYIGTFTLANNTSGASFVGTPTSTSAMVNSGSAGCNGKGYRVVYTITKNGAQVGAPCTKDVLVNDNVAPVFTSPCPSGSDLGCNPSGLPVTVNPSASDNCGTPTVTPSDGSITSTSCGRSQTRTYTARDACGNTATCSQTFTWVADLTGPVFTSCPSGSNLGCNPTSIPEAGTATATDACGTPTVTPSLGAEVGTGCNRSRTRTYTARDACGNSSTCQQVFTYTVDVTAPQFTVCPPGSNVGCNPTSFPAPGAATATDACGTPTVTPSLGAEVGTGCSRSRTRTYTAIDACGNSSTCQQVFTYTVDVTAPQFTFCPPGSNVGCNPTSFPEPGAATATDACGTPTISSVLGNEVGTGCSRSKTRTYTAIDACGNSSTCQQVFTYTFDVTPPVFTACQPDVTVECGSPTSTASLGSATASDACGSTTVTANDGAPIAVGCQTVIVRTWTARDACGNTATCVQRILVVDRVAPVITCNANGSATASDACGGSVYLYQNGTTWTAIDASGNIRTATCVVAPGARITSSQITAEQKEQTTPSVTEEKTKAAASVKLILQNNISVQTLPNPFNDKVKFIVRTPEAGYGTLEVMNMLGQKVKTVFQGRISAGGQSFEMVLPKSRNTTLFYILKMNGKQVTGKLVQMN